MQPDTTDINGILAKNPNLADLFHFIDGLPHEGLYVAFALTLLTFIIGWFGGTKKTKNKVIACVILITVNGFFALPIPAYIVRFFLPGMGIVWAFIIVYVIWSAVLVGMGISLYETFIVTAEEGRPN